MAAQSAAGKLREQGGTFAEISLPEGHDPNSFFVEELMWVCSVRWRQLAISFRVAHQLSTNPARCPYRVIALLDEIDWVNQYLDYETVRRLAGSYLMQSYANELLYFLRWWESVHRTDATTKDTSRNRYSFDYVRFPSGQ